MRNRRKIILSLLAPLVLAPLGWAQTEPASAAQSMPPAPANASSPVPLSSAAPVSPDYIIGTGDALQINVWKEPTISGSVPVRPDGMISLALLGDVRASGLTPMQLSLDITQRLKKSIIDPVVTVQVLNVNSKHVFLLGEVSKQGEVPLTPGMTPLQAIASAGGLTAYANSKHIYILRGAAGKQQKIPFDYKKAVKDGNLQGVLLAPDDTIYVP